MARAVAVLLLALGTIFIVAAACDEEDDFLLDPGPDATGTPPFLQRTPEPTPEPTPENSPVVDGGTPVSPFQVAAQGTVNVRSEPSTDGGDETIADTLSDGDSLTVIAEVSGEEVSGNNLWYQLDDGNFVWSGAVTQTQADPETGDQQEQPESTE